MNELFGLDMTYIAIGCVAVTALIFLFIAWIAIRNPVMFKTGLRNIPRRKAQTALIVVGLMLSTLIITAAFGTGDTMTNSVTNEVYTILGPTDEFVQWNQDDFPAAEDEQTIPLEEIDAWKAQLADDDIAALIPFLLEQIPVVNPRTRLNEANPRIAAFRPDDADAVGGLKDTSGNEVTLGPGDIALNRALADDLDAEVGDTVTLLYQGQPASLSVIAIVPNVLFAGSTEDTFNREGAAVNWDFLAGLLGKEGRADFVVVSNDGSERGGLDRTDEVTARLEDVIAGTSYEVETVKQDGIESAELVGNLFTTIFIIFGLFSIGAGILLIFLIFIMLAAERKPEMGMARAVGAKRRQIVESFLAEGMGYDLAAAIVGMFAGIGTAAAMIYFVKFRIGDALGLDLRFEISPRSLIVSFCIGLIVTFIVVFMASWRASRLNIVAAIRDLPETKPVNPEANTIAGYLRGVLNAFAVFGVLLISLLAGFRLSPLFFLGAIVGLAGLFLPMVRNANFGAAKADRKQGESLPKWPWIAGVLTAIIGVGVVMLVSYALAILVVALTRNRKRVQLSPGLSLAGIAIAPLGIVLTALQERARPVAWSAGFATVAAVCGLLLVEWGISDDRMAWFALGVSFVALWIAVTLTYFQVNARAVYTFTSAALLVIWYMLPGGRLEWLVGEMTGGPEMFFVTGAVLVTCGTFIVVYNADIILPAVATLGSRFGRILPALKTAIAYPLTSRFRTGLTIGMIGLIMFVLSMQAALNTNFSKTLTGDDARAGFDIQLRVNANNQTDDILAAIDEANAGPDVPMPVDTSKITAAGGMVVASPLIVDIEDPEWLKEDPAGRDPEDQWKQYDIEGVDQDFIANQTMPLQYRAEGYASDQDVWDALAANPQLAIIPSWLTVQDDFADDDFLSLPTDYTGDEFTPFDLTVRDRNSGTTATITVIGQTKDSASTFWPGIIVPEQTITETFTDADQYEYFLALEPGTDSREFAKSVESVLVQASAESMQQIIEDTEAQNRTFLEMFQGFLALGLLVGIAALGVISLRAVVERRQQIGMLRAIGYQRRMVQASFLMESGFIALAGILLGLVLGLSLSYILFTSGEFGDSARGISFTVPWVQVGAIALFALVAAMVTTYLPARAASRVAIAEALRYE